LLRAVETGLPLLRVTNSGITFAADPLGRVTDQLPPYQPGVLDVVPKQKLAETPFDRFGNWPFLGIVLLGISLGVLTRTRRPRRI
jgi:apolipoprotein N-acyltransferase